VPISWAQLAPELSPDAESTRRHPRKQSLSSAAAEDEDESD